MERGGVAVQDEVDGEVEGAEGDLQAAAEAAQQDVLTAEALAHTAAVAVAGRMVAAVAATVPRERQVVSGGGGGGSCGRGVVGTVKS